MIELSGMSAGSGSGHGPARRLLARVAVDERRVGDAQVIGEVQRFDAAVVTTDAAMERIGGGDGPDGLRQEMVDTHRAILSSPEVTEQIRKLIGERQVAAEWAVQLVLEELRRTFAAMSDERFAARFEDVDAVAARLLDALRGQGGLVIDDSFRGAVAIGWELSPLDALELHRFGVAGFVTEHGGPTSHTAIIARTLGIPYVFGVHGLMAGVRPGETVWIDGTDNRVVASPDAVTTQALEARRHAADERQRAVAARTHAPAVTRDGTTISVGANVESAEEVTAAIALGADHVGLVRTELLYLGAAQLPTEERQYADACAIVRAAGGRPVTFRTLDLGGDKLPAGVQVPSGHNPALGLRGIRLSLRRPEMFATQLRALFRAAATGPMRVLLPLVATVEEVRQVRAACASICADLQRQGIPHDPKVALGAMIETPSAALTADHIARECDFLSVGTNDLVQYAFAADRQSAELAFLYQPLHPAMLRALDGIFSAARRAQRPVSVCGDVAGDPLVTQVLLGLGLRSFSMPGRAVPFVKAAIRAASLASASALVEAARACTTHDEVMALARAAAATNA